MGAKPRTTSPSTGERNPVHPAVARKDAITANATTGYTRTVSLLRRRDDTVSGWCHETTGVPESAYSASQDSANYGLAATSNFGCGVCWLLTECSVGCVVTGLPESTRSSDWSGLLVRLLPSDRRSDGLRGVRESCWELDGQCFVLLDLFL